MRARLFVLLLALALAAGGWAAAQENAPAPGVDQGREILDKVVQALGGPAFLDVRDITRRGRLYGFDRGELASPGDRFLDYVKFPGKERTEIGKDGKIVYLNNNDQGWELDRQGVREQSPEQVEDFQKGTRRDFDYLLRFRLQQEKLQTYYLGREFVDNRSVHVVELVDEDNQSLKVVVDAKTYLPVQFRYRQRDVLSGEWMDVVEYYGKYITVQGIKTSMHQSRERAGKRNFEVYFTEVEYNTNVPDELFTRASLEERWQKIK